jgi:hypothetical protein
MNISLWLCKFYFLWWAEQSITLPVWGTNYNDLTMLEAICLSNICWYPVQNANLRWYLLMLWSCGWSALSTCWVVACSCLPFSSWFSCWFWPFSSWVTPCHAPPGTAAVGLTFSSWDDLELQVTPWLLLGVIRMVWWNCGRTVCSFVCWGCACRLGATSSWPSWSTPPAASLGCCGVDNTTPQSWWLSCL